MAKKITRETYLSYPGNRMVYDAMNTRAEQMRQWRLQNPSLFVGKESDKVPSWKKQIPVCTGPDAVSRPRAMVWNKEPDPVVNIDRSLKLPRSKYYDDKKYPAKGSK